MIKKLRRRFILVAILSVFFVLFITIGTINITNYCVIENNAGNTVNQIINQGPRPGETPGGGPGQDEPPELKQEHYFIVTYNNDGSIKEVDNRQMFVLSKDECIALASKVYNNEISGGKYDTFRYQKVTKGDGITYIGFLDIKEKLDSFNSFLLLSSLVSLGAYAALIGLIVLGSNIAFKSSIEAYKKQKRFITNASHELKTPLTVISADIDLIEMDYGKSEWSESIRDQLTRLTEMTNQLVTLSKLEEDDPTRFPFNDFSLNEVANRVIESFIPSFKKEGIKFSYNIASNITMFANKNLIIELISIFLDNSLKYTGGDNKSSYFVIVENNKKKIEFRFSNTLDKDDEVDIKQVMERFYRSPTNKKEGSGIGLSVAQEIINLHKAKIDVDKNNSVISFLITF